MRQVFRIALVTVVVAGVTLHGGKSLDEDIILSWAIAGNPTLTEYDCGDAPNPIVWVGADSKSWPVGGEYSCQNNGPHGYLDASPNPLVATGTVSCLLKTRFCAPVFSEISAGVANDAIGPLASVTVQNRSPATPPAICTNSGPIETLKAHTSFVYNTSAICNPEPDCSACAYPAESVLTCSVDGGYFDEECSCCVDPWSPIIIDLAGDGFTLSSKVDGVSFDIDGDGDLDRVPWTTASTNDVWLTLDRNGNGLVDSGRELFGNFTAQPTSPDKNGFLALAVFDGADAGGTGDGSIDARDAIFGQLRLWRDKNHDGISQSTELRSLKAAGVSRLSLDYKESRRVDKFGNWFRYKARVIDAHGRDVGQWAYDVYLGGKPPGTRKPRR